MPLRTALYSPPASVNTPNSKPFPNPCIFILFAKPLTKIPLTLIFNDNSVWSFTLSPKSKLVCELPPTRKSISVLSIGPNLFVTLIVTPDSAPAITVPLYKGIIV